MTTSLHDVSDWLFRDRGSGRTVIAQMPNATAWTALAASAFRLAVPTGRAATAAGYVLVAALVIWALDEIARGVNPWRRFLGAGCLVAIAAWLLVQER